MATFRVTINSNLNPKSIHAKQCDTPITLNQGSTQLQQNSEVMPVPQDKRQLSGLLHIDP